MSSRAGLLGKSEETHRKYPDLVNINSHLPEGFILEKKNAEKRGPSCYSFAK